ncbi:alpha/beta hydrolase [Nocardioides sp. TF02-7]|uniref:alpha/beta hydrolase n=1 Tax=Nocardioides sp. TF02-7 TaxID=2917724 RepID=UPI001F05D074|nr:alpha/beta hydrolase [Nocardioides sp. TF02-7]UMG92330.1 alpha/beta hydrolase [Nocardioides sp. TF02-7]
MLDVYTSDRTPTSGAPVLLQVHGGAWVTSRKEEQGLPSCSTWPPRGWVCVAVNYRLAPRDPWPAQIEDVKRAIAWVKDNIADHGGDPDYLAITGGSAGGHLAALAALTPNDPALQPGFEDADTSVQVAVPHYGVYDLAGASGIRHVEVMRDTLLAKHVMQVPYAEAPEVYEAASPLLRVTADAPDFFVVHGAVDTLVGVDQARQLVARLREVSKRTVVYAELPGTQHAFDVFPSIRSQHVVHAIDRYLHWHWNTWRREQTSTPASS